MSNNSNQTNLRPPPPSSNKRRPLSRACFAEVAGTSAADCVAICCCCPCALFKVLVLIICKTPAGLCRRAVQNSKSMRRKAYPAKKVRCLTSASDGAAEIRMEPVITAEKREEEEEWEREAEELEKEMWARFCSSGFWRSPSPFPREQL